jgi:cytosine/uracil/thiamine/allantoin permease
MTLSVILIGLLLTVLEVVSSAYLAFSFKQSLSPMVNNVVSGLLTIVFVIFWTVFTMLQWKGNPKVQRRMLLSAEVSFVAFIVIEIFLVVRYGTVNLFFHNP